jgi:predicted regulator of Ras-like GTPase activity (Roadblock/LC7/MglB family)
LQRDQSESEFTPILRELWASVPVVLAAVFVDVDGECIDYVSSIDPYEAKVNAAHAAVLVDCLRRGSERLGLREPVTLEISGAKRELWVRRITEEHLLCAVLAPGFDRGQFRGLLSRAARGFRDELGLERPAWDPGTDTLDVVVRAAVGWAYAPESFVQDGMRVSVVDVMGRWVEPNAEQPEASVCFLVRTEQGREVTLVHDPNTGDWGMRA